MKSGNFFIFVLECTQREHVQNLKPNIYKFCIKIVGLNGSYSANTQPILKQRYPRGA